jgi:serine/threonine protein kinase
MADITKYEPLWDTWYIDSRLGKGCFGEVYKIRRQAFGKTHYSALKRISIPYDEDELRQMRSEMGETALRGFLRELLKDLVDEIDLMSELRGNSNIVSLEDYKLVKKPHGFGWDMLIRMELLESLPNRVAEAPLALPEILKMGRHICRALEICAVKNIIHRDIKPANIFISQYGEYKLGDFGIARRLEPTMSGLSKKGTYNYMAPEVFKGEPYGASVDTYSLGLVLYQFLNRNRGPFLPDFPQSLMPRDVSNAMQRRMRGERLPDLKGVSPALNALVLKACAYSKEERFASPAEMREGLERVALPTEGTQRYLPDSKQDSKPKRGPVRLIALLSACGVLAAAIILACFSLGGDSQGRNPHGEQVDTIVADEGHNRYGSITINDYYGSVTVDGDSRSPGKQSGKDITNASLAAMVTNGELPADLTWLQLDDNIISDITPLKTLTGLIYIDLRENGVESLSSLSSMAELQALFVSDNPVRDLTPLQSLESLRVLRLSRTKVTDLTPLKALPKMRSLCLDGTAVSDYTPLQSMNLRHLTVSNINDIEVLKSLTTLKRLTIYGSKLSPDQDLELRAALPNCEINIYI